MSKNFAIVIGINQYNPRNFASLNYAKHDAELIRDFFQNEAQFDEIIFFSDNSPELELPDGTFISTNPSGRNLKSFLHDRFETPFLTTGDNCWFFFSGHGYRHSNRDYLMPIDASDREIEDTGIQVNYVRERLSGCGSDNIILILDACRSEGSSTATGKSISTTGIGREAPHGVITIYSCRPTQRSWEIDDLKHSVFTYALLEALRLQDRDNNCATVKRLNKYLKKRVPELCEQNNKALQNPVVNIEPLEKQHFILIPQRINQRDIQSDIVMMEHDAYRIEQEGKLDEAENIWTRLLKISPSSHNSAIKSLQRIAIKREDLIKNPFKKPSPKWIERISLPKIINNYKKKMRKSIKTIIDWTLIDLRRTWVLVFCAIIFAIFIAITFGNLKNLWQFQKPPSNPETTFKKPKSNSEFISDGEKSLFETQYFELSSEDFISKTNGMTAFSRGDDFNGAFDLLDGIRRRAKKYIKDHPKEISIEKANYLAALKDPELLIFANNAKLKTPSYSNLPFNKIAVIVPTNVGTSAANAVGKYFLWGVAQAQDEAIYKKLGLHIQIVNDGNDENQSKKVAQELMNDSSIVGVVGHYLSTTTCASLPIYNEKLAIVSPASRAFNLRQKCSKNGNKNANKNFFRTAASSQVEAISLVNHLLSKFKQNKLIKIVAFYNSLDPYSNTVFEQFKTHLENTRGKVIPVDIKDRVLAAYEYQKNIKEAEATAIAVFPDGQKQENLKLAVAIIKEYGNNKLILAGNTLYFQEQLSNMAEKFTPGNVVIAVDWHSGMPGAEKFAQDERNYWHGDINFRTALAYEATQVFIEALTNIPSSNTDGSKINTSQLRSMVKDEIFKLTFSKGRPNLISNRPILEGRHISFDENGDRYEKQNVCVTPIRTENQNSNINKNRSIDKEPKYNFLPNSSCDKQDIIH